jgi:hypothetical protein
MDKEYSHILIMGDFNYPKINWKQWSSSGDKDAEISSFPTYIPTPVIAVSPLSTMNKSYPSI